MPLLCSVFCSEYHSINSIISRNTRLTYPSSFPFLSRSEALPFIQGALKYDPNLDKVRYKLVPKRLKELDFFRNYFYRISLIREDMKFEALPISTEVILPEEMTGQQNSIVILVNEKNAIMYVGHLYFE